MKNKLIEKIAELEHVQWMSWATSIMNHEKISQNRIDRWNTSMIPYEKLTEEQKDQDRYWAEKVIEIVINYLGEK